MYLASVWRGDVNVCHHQAIIQVVVTNGHVVALAEGHVPLILCLLDDSGIVPLEGRARLCLLPYTTPHLFMFYAWWLYC